MKVRDRIDVAPILYLLQVDGEDVPRGAERFKGLAGATQHEGIPHLIMMKGGKEEER